MAFADANAAVASAEREHVAGAAEGGFGRGCGGEGAAGESSVVGGDSGCDGWVRGVH